MIEPGTYKARGVAAQLGYAQTGTEQVGVQLRLENGQTITWYGFFTEKTTERTLESLRHLGWDGEDILDLSGITKNEVEVVIEEEADRNGEIRARVKWINAPGALAMKRVMGPADAKAFAQRMKGVVVASKQKAKAAAPAQQQTSRQAAPARDEPPMTAYEDDIPFMRVDERWR